MIKHLTLLIVIVFIILASSAYAIESSALSNTFKLDTRTFDPMESYVVIESSALSNAFTLDTKDYSANMCDFNKDGLVNILDLMLLAKNFGKTGDDIVGDINGDEKVDNRDIDILIRYFGEKI